MDAVRGPVAGRMTGRGDYPLTAFKNTVRAAIVLIAISQVVHAQTGAVLEVGTFSAAVGGRLPEEWKPLAFNKGAHQTSYAIVKDGDTMVVRATSEAGSSALMRQITINPQEFPIIQWRWKVSTLIRKSDTTKKEGDDYPARLYISFAYAGDQVGLFERFKYEAARLFYGQYPPLGAINYIWAHKEPKGTIVANPYTDRSKMLVVESGSANLNKWITEERNVYQDYRQAFGEDPPLIAGVAIMTDTDDTKESATAYYGDILFKKAGAP